MSAAAAIESAWRTHWARLLAVLVRRFRDVDLAEDCLQEAFAAASAAWARSPPANPPAWLLTAAHRRALDVRRRRATAARKAHLVMEDDTMEPDAPGEAAEIADERLALISLCCHPALSPEARIALTLRLVGGLTTAEIARLFFVSEPTMAARLTRAKQKIAAARIPFALPSPADLRERLAGVMAVVYLIFTEGYAPSSGERVVRDELCAEAIRLGRLLVEIAPGEREAAELLALMLLHHARREARTGANGETVLLRDQDRGRWRLDEIAEGRRLLDRAGDEGSYALQAAIAAAHVAPETDWPRIAALYARLEAVTPSPAVRLNRAIAVAEAEGPAAGLALLDGLDAALGASAALPVTRAELLVRLGRFAEAVPLYDLAIARTALAAERDFLTRRRAAAAAG